MDLYPWLKAVHVLLGMVAVGINVSYAVWVNRAAREPQHFGYALRGIKFLDDRIANPSYIALAVVGVSLILIGPYEFTDAWVIAAIGLYVLLAAIGIGGYSPTLSRQIVIYETDGPDAPEFHTLSTRGTRIGQLLAALVVVIVFLMVVKPGG
jgi:uncharacterized membrane protein